MGGGERGDMKVIKGWQQKTNDLLRPSVSFVLHGFQFFGKGAMSPSLAIQKRS
jgi:hypothetical protein